MRSIKSVKTIIIIKSIKFNNNDKDNKAVDLIY